MSRKIAVISEHASPLAVLGGVDSGGQNVYVGQLAKHLAAGGYQVDVFTRRDRAQLPEVVDWLQNVRVIHVPAGPAEFVPKEALLPYMREFTDYMIRCCQHYPYDLLHANFWMSGLVAAEVKRALKLPFVITFHALGRVRRLHQGEADKFPDSRFDIEARLVAEADRIIAECPQDEADLIQLYQADPAKIRIVPCGFDPAEFEPINKTMARLVLGLPTEERIILQLGRMVPRKGVDNVIRGFAQLQRDYDLPARLLVVGGEADEPDPQLTPEIGRLQTLAVEEGVADRVTFVGRRSRDILNYYYSAADVFVSTPWYEPFGITPVEAMACGTPVIGANVGGIKYSVSDGQTGYLIPPNDPAALAERLAHLYQQPDLLDRLGQQAIERANEFFTWQKVAEAMASVYEEIFAANPLPQTDEVDELAIIDRGFETALETFRQSRRLLRLAIAEAAQVMGACFAQGGKVLICGNGGSAAEAQHLAGELVGRFKQPNRAALPAVALTADSSVVTAWSNDIGFDDIFARQVEALGQPGDVLVALSTSGQSRNLVKAVEAARRCRMTCIALLGGDGGETWPLSDIAVVIPSSDAQRIQETHLFVLHLLCELVEVGLAAGRWSQTMLVETALPGWPVPLNGRAKALMDGPGNGKNKEEKRNGYRQTQR
ncbi:MAG: glycosyltransferase [Anaerolineales bacterium]|nr:glycosyltransferase [Anaerolineales bacterium]